MKDSPIQFVFGFIAIILGAGAEEMLPKFLGVGFPLLLSVVQCVSQRTATIAAMAALAVGAGATEDALCSLPPLTSVSYFLIIAAFSRWSGVPRLAMVLTYPCYQLWLALWTGGLGGGIFNRILLSLPIGLVTVFAVGAVISWAKGKAAIDERD